jgi:hypothetical protein
VALTSSEVVPHCAAATLDLRPHERSGFLSATPQAGHWAGWLKSYFSSQPVADNIRTSSTAPRAMPHPILTAVRGDTIHPHLGIFPASYCKSLLPFGLRWPATRSRTGGDVPVWRPARGAFLGLACDSTDPFMAASQTLTPHARGNSHRLKINTFLRYVGAFSLDSGSHM